jgi:hypothetical protein
LESWGSLNLQLLSKVRGLLGTLECHTWLLVLITTNSSNADSMFASMLNRVRWFSTPLLPALLCIISHVPSLQGKSSRWDKGLSYSPLESISSSTSQTTGGLSSIWGSQWYKVSLFRDTQRPQSRIVCRFCPLGSMQLLSLPFQLF